MTMESLIDSIDHVVLNCTNVDVTAAWFRRALGAEIQTYGQGRRAVVVGRQKVNLRPVGSTDWETATCEEPGALDICSVAACPLAEVIDHWHAHNIEIVEGPIQRSGTLGPITSIYARDPDGNLIEVASYL